jgi:hypothetical protein
MASFRETISKIWQGNKSPSYSATTIALSLHLCTLSCSQRILSSGSTGKAVDMTLPIPTNNPKKDMCPPITANFKFFSPLLHSAKKYGAKKEQTC